MTRIVESLESESSLILAANQDNEYILETHHIEPRTRAIYFDKQKKVAEIIRTENYLAINLFVEEQVNLFFDIDIDFLSIEAQGPLCIDGTIDVNKAFKLKALSAQFCQDVQSKKVINFELQGGFIFEKLLKTEFLTLVSSGECHNMGQLQVQQFADLAVSQWIQAPQANCTINGTWRFVGDSCQLAGGFTVKNKSFVKSKRFILGHQESEADINFSGDIYLNVDELETHGGLKCSINQKDSSDHDHLTVNQSFKIDAQSKMTMFGAKINIGLLHNEGELRTQNCQIVIQRCYQKNRLHFNDSQVTIHEQMTQENGILEQTAGRETLPNFTVKRMSVKSGNVKLMNTCLYGDQWNVYGGMLEMENSALDLAQSLFIYDPASIKATSAQLNIKQTMNFRGILTFSGCHIKSESLDAQGSLEKSLFHHSRIQVDRDAIFWKNLQLNTVEITSYRFSIKGDLNVDNVVVKTTGLATWQMIGSARNVYSTADRLEFNGAEELGKISCFEKSYFEAKAISHQGRIRFLNSEIHGSGEEDRSHSIQGTMWLDNSQFFTKSQVFQDRGSHLSLVDKSQLKAGVIANNGKLSAMGAALTAKKLVQDKAELHTQRSQIHIETKVYNRDSKMSFTDNSVVVVDDMTVDGFLKLKDSTLQSKKSIVSINSKTSITAEDSKIDTEDLFLIGPVSFAKSRLNTQQLAIYHQFSVEGSLIKITKEFSIAREGALQLTSSQLSATRGDILGKLVVDKSLVDVGEDLQTASTSALEMKGQSLVKAKDVEIRGLLTTQSQEVVIEKDEQKKSKKQVPQIHVKESLTFGVDSQVSGDNLVIEAKHVDIEGQVKLSDSLVAKGGDLVNLGSIETGNQTFLGFDDYVSNTGYIDSNNVTVHSNLFNILGRISARQMFSNSGFFSANLGIYRATNTNINSLISLNSGLILPNFSGGFSNILSWRNIAMGVRLALSTVVPRYTNLINLAFMAPSLYSTGLNFYKMGRSYYDGSARSFSQIRRHELMPMICQIKSAALLAYNAGNAVHGTVSEIHSAYRAFFPEEQLDMNVSAETVAESNVKPIGEPSPWFENFDWAKTGRMAITVFGGSYTDESLVHFNTGLSATMNMSKTSIWDCNVGAELTLGSHLVNTHYLYNAGMSYGGQSTFLAHQIENTGTMGGYNSLRILAMAMTNYGQVEGYQNDIRLDSLEQRGTFDLTEGTVKVKKFQEFTGASSRLENLIMKGGSYHTAGTVKASKVYFDFAETIKTEVGAVLNMQDSWVSTAHFSSAGTVNYQGVLKIKSETFHTQEGSQLDGAVSKTAEVETQEKIVDEQGQETTVTRYAPVHKLVIESQQTILDGKQSGGDYTSITGDSLVVEKSGDVHLEHGVVKQEKNIMVQGNLGADKSSIEAKEVILEQEGSLVTNQTHVKTQLLEQKGTLSLSDSHLQADQFRDQEKAPTTLTNTIAEGARFDLQGHLKAKNSDLLFTERVISAATSTKDVDNLYIRTKDFVSGGDTHYKNVYQIDTETYTTTSGSHLNGTQSEPLAQLQTQSDLTGEATSETLKPTHVFMLNTKDMALGGQQAGGDYTQMIAENTMKVKEGADVKIHHGYMKASHSEIDGGLHLQGQSHLDSRMIQVNQKGSFSLDKSSTKGEQLTSHGSSIYTESYVEVDDVTLASSATESIKDSTFKTKTFDDRSHLTYQGQVIIETEKYLHGGRVQIQYPAENPENNVFHLKSKSAQLSGSAQIGHGILEIGHFDQISQLVAGVGQFAGYQFKQSFDFQTQDQVRLTDQLQRDCDVFVTGSSLDLDVRYKSQHTLKFASTQGNVTLLHRIQADNVLVDSAGDIYTNRSVYADHGIQFTAKGAYYNLGGKLDGDVVTVQAAKIINVTKGSEVAQNSWQFSIGRDGVINGRTTALLETTSGNIENHGGIIRGGDYLQLVAAGDILNVSNQRSYEGEYDIITAYDPALVVGGKGTQTGGLGLYVQAGRKVKCDASNFLAEGDVYIDGLKGVKFSAEHDTYISKDKKKKKWYGKKEHTVETHTDIYHSTVHSERGRSIIRSAEGGVRSTATIFSSAQGTDIHAQQSVQLFSLKTQDKTYKSKEQFWGLTKDSHKEKHQSSSPTLFIDNGYTRIHSELGDVDARGALFLGGGDLSIKAGKRIKFGCDILDHEVMQKSQSLSLSGFGIGAVDAWKEGRGVLGVLSAEDTTFAKLEKLLHSENLLDTGINGSNFAISAFNATNDLIRGLAHHDLTSELLSRYSLGGAEGFSPTFSVNFNHTKTTDKYQSLGAGGVDRRHVHLEAGEGIDVENGVRIHARGDMEIQAPEVIASAAELRSSHRQETREIKVGMSVTGQVTDVGLSYAQEKAENVNHVNAEISAEGHLSLGEMDRLSLSGANITADTIEGHVKQLEIESLQDTSHSSSKQISASSSGQVGIYASRESSKITVHPSGIHVKQGINYEQETFVVDEYHSRGGKITSQGQNNFKAKEVTSEELQDYHKKSGFGISMNVHDLERVRGSKPSNQVGEKALATAAVTVDSQSFQAVQSSVIHGEQGTTLDIVQQQGVIYTEDASGVTVQKDHSLHASIDVPLTNSEHLSITRDNISGGLQTLAEPKIIPAPKIQDLEMKEKEQEPVVLLEDKSEVLQDERIQVTEVLTAALQSSTPEQQQELNALCDKASQEIEETQLISSETQKQLESTMLDVLIKTLKAGGELGYDKMAAALQDQHAAVKCYVGAKGLMFSFAMNMALSKEKSSSGMMQDALLTTASDCIVNFTMGRCLGKVAGPIGWTMTGVDIVDSLLYRKESSDSWRERAEACERAADTTESLLMKQAYWEMADDRREVFQTMETFHAIAEGCRAVPALVQHGLETGIKASQNVYNLFNSKPVEKPAQSAPTPTPTPIPVTTPELH